MAKKATKRVRVRKPKAAAPISASDDASPAPTGPPTQVINLATGKPVHVSVHEGKTFAGGNGKLIFVDTFPNQHLMTVEDAADNFALRTADNVALYSEKGFGAPVPEGLQPLDIAALIEES